MASKVVSLKDGELPDTVRVATSKMLESRILRVIEVRQRGLFHQDNQAQMAPPVPVSQYVCVRRIETMR